MSDTVNAQTTTVPDVGKLLLAGRVLQSGSMFGAFWRGAYCVRLEIKCSSRAGKGSTLGTEQRAWAAAVTPASQWAWALDPVHQHLPMTSQQW